MGGFELCLRFVLDVLILLILSLVLSLSLARALSLHLCTVANGRFLGWDYTGEMAAVLDCLTLLLLNLYISTCDTHNTHSLLTHACFLTLVLLLPWPLNYLTLATEPSPHRLGLSQPPPKCKWKVTEGNR